MKTAILLFGLGLSGLVIYSCHKTQPFTKDQLDERMSGGDCTAFDESSGAYGNLIPGLSERDEQFHDVGDKFFETSFIPSGGQANGLGPLYHQVSCARCHVNEGRGLPPLGGVPTESFFLRLSMPGEDAHGAPLNVPGFGSQLQDRAVNGFQPEGLVDVSYFETDEFLADGTKVSLRKPTYTIINPYTSLPAGMLMSPRMARPNFGMGLIEAISDASLLKNEDPMDANGDGVSGRANRVYDYLINQANAIGRIGWKAAVPNIKNQAAKALLEDIGITTSVFAKSNAVGQPQAKGDVEAELHDSILNSLTFYMQTLAVPARRKVDDPVVKQGQKVFAQSGCIKCHVDLHETNVNVAFKPLSAQLIRPYSDFLLHDMGAGLADGRPEFKASGSEWRTPPLWGIGLSERVNGHTNYLHDGRARTFSEAVMWHSGEAQSAKNNFKNLSTAERETLLKFLGSL